VSDPSDAGIDVLLRERRTLPPSPASTGQAIVSGTPVSNEAEARKT
jgi:hypothetical protein